MKKLNFFLTLFGLLIFFTAHAGIQNIRKIDSTENLSLQYYIADCNAAFISLESGIFKKWYSKKIAPIIAKQLEVKL